MNYLQKHYKGVADLLKNAKASAKLFENFIEDSRINKDGEVEFAIRTQGKDELDYVNINKLTKMQMKKILESYNEFLELHQIQEPDVYTSYLKNRDEYIESLKYVMTKPIKSNKGAREIYAKYTGNTPESFDELTVKERMTANSLFNLAKEYHLLDRLSDYYSTETIKTIYEVATDKRYKNLTMQDFRAELIERLYDLDIITNDMYNKMITGQRVSIGLSPNDKSLLMGKI